MLDIIQFLDMSNIDSLQNFQIVIDIDLMFYSVIM